MAGLYSWDYGDVGGFFTEAEVDEFEAQTYEQHLAEFEGFEASLVSIGGPAFVTWLRTQQLGLENEVARRAQALRMTELPGPPVTTAVAFGAGVDPGNFAFAQKGGVLGRASAWWTCHQVPVSSCKLGLREVGWAKQSGSFVAGSGRLSSQPN